MKTPGLFILAMILAVFSANADSRTTRGKLKAIGDRIELSGEPVDSLAVLPEDSIKIAGYDKALRSSRESFMATNHYSSPIVMIVVDIVYKDVRRDGMLHARRVKMECLIPPGETRQLECPSWDRQNRYYFHHTRVIPRSTRAIPYSVDIYPREVKLADEK